MIQCQSPHYQEFALKEIHAQTQVVGWLETLFVYSFVGLIREKVHELIEMHLFHP